MVDHALTTYEFVPSHANSPSIPPPPLGFSPDTVVSVVRSKRYMNEVHMVILLAYTAFTNACASASLCGRLLSANSLWLPCSNDSHEMSDEVESPNNKANDECNILIFFIFFFIFYRVQQLVRQFHAKGKGACCRISSAIYVSRIFRIETTVVGNGK